jgi:hypothetical protein
LRIELKPHLHATGLQPGNALGRFIPDDLVIVHRMNEIPYDQIPADSIQQKRLVECNEVVYRRNDLSGLLPLGKLESLALPGQNYNLCLTPRILSTLHRDDENLLPDAATFLPSKAGFVDLKNDGNWWAPSNLQFYNALVDASTSDEVQTAQLSFYLPQRITDPFGEGTIVRYDNHHPTATSVTDPIQSVVSGELSYRVLELHSSTDANGNRSEITSDALGAVAGLAVMGKPGEPVGDSLEGLRANSTDVEIDNYFTDPRASGKGLLGRASSRFIYEVNSFWKEGPKSPTRTSSISRQAHFHDGGSLDSDIQIAIAYTDGSGRVIQQKTQAEPDNAEPAKPRWRGTGWKVFNNKGLPVQAFEPFFTSSPGFQSNFSIGVSAFHLYDPMNRDIAILMPNKTCIKHVYGSWKTEIWDPNDTVRLNIREDLDIGPAAKFFQIPIIDDVVRRP